MLEAAMLGVPYEGPVPDAGGGGGLGVSGYGLRGALRGGGGGAPIRSDTTGHTRSRCARPRKEGRAAAEAAARAAEAEAAEKAAAEAAEAARAAAARDALVAAANEALPTSPLRATTASWTSR